MSNKNLSASITKEKKILFNTTVVELLSELVSGGHS